MDPADSTTAKGNPLGEGILVTFSRRGELCRAARSWRRRAFFTDVNLKSRAIWTAWDWRAGLRRQRRACSCWSRPASTLIGQRHFRRTFACSKALAATRRYYCIAGCGPRAQSWRPRANGKLLPCPSELPSVGLFDEYCRNHPRQRQSAHLSDRQWLIHSYSDVGTM